MVGPEQVFYSFHAEKSFMEQESVNNVLPNEEYWMITEGLRRDG